VTDAWETVSPTVCTDAVLKKQMTTIHADLDAVAEKSHDPVPGYQ
jgi:hypothetical protein